MAKDINLLQQVFNKSWKLYDEQFSQILQEAATIFEWMNQVIPAAEEALNRKTACNLPKTPHIKRRKIDEPQKKQIDQDQTCSTSDGNGEVEIVEAKRPRQLRPRRNTRATNRRSSKGVRSKQYQKKAVSQVNRLSRVTRASCKKDPLANSIVEKDNSINEDGNLDDENISDATESNTTKSFIEHENDIGCSDGITEITSKCLAVSLDDVLCKEGTSKIPEDPASSENTTENNNEKITTDYIVENETVMLNDGIEQLKGSLEIAKLPMETIRSQPFIETVNTRVEERTQEIPEDEKDAKVSSDQKMPTDDRNEKSENGEFDFKAVAHENNKGALKGDSPLTKNVDSLSKICPQGQIAKIKERLFEKITVSSSCSPTRQSPQLMSGRQSPQLMTGRRSPRLMSGRQSPQCGKFPIKVATPKVVNSPGTKQKFFEQNPFDEKMEILSNEQQEDEIICAEKFDNENKVENEKKDASNENLPNSVGPKIIKPVKPKNLLTGVHTMIKAANQKSNVINQGTVTKQGNIVTGLFSFLKSNTIEKKAESIQERKQRMEDEAKKREEARMRLIQQAEQRKQKEIEERKKRRQEREQRVAEVQAKKAQEEKEKQEQTQKRFEMMKKNEEKLRKIKEKEEELKKRIREKKMAEAEAKRKQEENERLAKMAEKEEEERRKAEYLQRKQEFEEMERKKKIEEQKKAEEQRHEGHAKEMQLQEERLRREIEEREAQVRKRLEEKERELKEMQDRKKIEKEREEQERLRKEEQEKLKKEMLEREKAEKERIERELEERQKKEIQAKENDRKIKEEREREAKERELKERKELKAAKEKEIKDREAYYRKKLEQKQFGEPKRTFDKAELETRQPLMKSPAHPVPHAVQQKVHTVQCTSYNTPTLTRVTTQKNKPQSLQNYDINSLSEDDSTDDEEDPAQEIPSWAKGTTFKRAILAQIQSNTDPRGIFVNMLEAPKLEKMFPKLRARFFKRTSSACWDHPPRPFKTMLH